MSNIFFNLKLIMITILKWDKQIVNLEKLTNKRLTSLDVGLQVYSMVYVAERLNKI